MEKRAHAGGGAESGSYVRFGPFELDLRRGEYKLWARSGPAKRPHCDTTVGRNKGTQTTQKH